MSYLMYLLLLVARGHTFSSANETALLDLANETVPVPTPVSLTGAWVVLSYNHKIEGPIAIDFMELKGQHGTKSGVSG